MGPGAVAELGGGDYISLTTYRRSGVAVPTPVWVTSDGESLFVITDEQSGKVKRLRHTDRVDVAPCDMRGKITGASYPGTAELLDEAGSRRVEEMVVAKYGWLARAFAAVGTAQGLLGKLLRRPSRPGRIGIRIRLADGAGR